MEVLFDPAMWTWPDREVVGELAVKKFVDTCNEQRRNFLRDSGEPSLEPAVHEDYNERVQLGVGMLRYFYREQLPKNPEGFRPIRVEVSFEVPIKHPGTGEPLRCKCDKCWDRWCASDDYTGVQLKDNWKGLPVVYAGRIDCLMQDNYGDYWIVDWKTTRAISGDDQDEFLMLDDQIGSYCWALRELGLSVRGFVYHQQKKGYPQPPTRNKVNRLGCWYSVSKNQDTDYDTYLATVQAEDPQAYHSGAYDEFLIWLRDNGPQYYRRWTIFKSDYELDEIGRNIGLETLDMLDPSLRIYPNTGRFGCSFCAFRQPCLGRFRGEDYEYTLATLFKREEPYYYRQQRGASTESKGGE